MKRVIKHTIPVDDAEHEIEIPGYWTRVLHVANQSGPPNEVQAWFEVDTEAPMHTFTFRVFGTGEPIGKGPGTLSLHPWGHRGTCLVLGGAQVWHLYELITEEPF